MAVAPRPGPNLSCCLCTYSDAPVGCDRDAVDSVGPCAGPHRIAAPPPPTAHAARPPLAESAGQRAPHSAGRTGAWAAASSWWTRSRPACWSRRCHALVYRPLQHSAPFGRCPLHHLAAGVAADLSLDDGLPRGTAYVAVPVRTWRCTHLDLIRRPRLSQSVSRCATNSRAAITNCAHNTSTTRRVCCPTISPQHRSWRWMAHGQLLVDSGDAPRAGRLGSSRHRAQAPRMHVPPEQVPRAQVPRIQVPLQLPYVREKEPLATVAGRG